MKKFLFLFLVFFLGCSEPAKDKPQAKRYEPGQVLNYKTTEMRVVIIRYEGDNEYGVAWIDAAGNRRTETVSGVELEEIPEPTKDKIEKGALK